MTDTETPVVEVLDAETLDVVTPTTTVDAEASAMIIQAGEAALSLPESPSAEEFYALAAMALMLHRSPAAPKEIQESPHLAFHMAMLARDLRVSPSAALQMIDVIPEGGNRPPQLTIKPRMKGAQVERLGMGEIVQGEANKHRAVAIAIGKGGADPQCRRENMARHCLADDVVPEPCGCDYKGRTIYTWEDAQDAGYADTRCNPGEHKTSGDGCRCKDNYRKIAGRMLWQRAQGFCADDWFKMSSVGLYDADELGYVTDTEGNVIDPSQVAVPRGYEPPPPEAPGTPTQIGWVKELFRRLKVLEDTRRENAAGKYAERYKRTPPEELPASELAKFTKLFRSMIRDADEIMARPDLAEDAPADTGEPQSDSEQADTQTPDPEPGTSPTATVTAPGAEADVEIDPDTGEVMAVSPNPSGTDPEPAPEPEAKPEQSAAEALSNRGKAVGIDEFTTICIDGGSTVSEVMNIVVAALAELKLDYGRTYADIVPFEPEILGDAADLLQSGSIPTVDLLVASYKAAQQ